MRSRSSNNCEHQNWLYRTIFPPADPCKRLNRLGMTSILHLHLPPGRQIVWPVLPRMRTLAILSIFLRPNTFSQASMRAQILDTTRKRTACRARASAAERSEASQRQQLFHLPADSASRLSSAAPCLSPASRRLRRPALFQCLFTQRVRVYLARHAKKARRSVSVAASNNSTAEAEGLCQPASTRLL